MMPDTHNHSSIYEVYHQILRQLPLCEQNQVLYSKRLQVPATHKNKSNSQLVNIADRRVSECKEAEKNGLVFSKKNLRISKKKFINLDVYEFQEKPILIFFREK